MRYDTLLKTTQAIVERQLAFFERGEEGTEVVLTGCVVHDCPPGLVEGRVPQLV